MGNLIRDFWTYTYKDKNYFGVLEVIKGEDLSQNRNEKKYETHIEKAINYTYKNDVLSHMSIQTYCTWLKDRSSREENEQKYYPFILEFESNKKDKYFDVVYEVAVYVNYLINELHINREDILIMINNSKSLYVYVNPKVYCAKPNKDLHKIYFEMYKSIKDELKLKYVDESIVASSYKLMKTPNTYYKGGYFTWITIEELMKLLTGVVTKEELTASKRSLDKKIPGEISLKASRLYSNAIKKSKNEFKSKERNYENTDFGCKCVTYLLQNMIEKGHRNYGLVSVGIHLKKLGYSKIEVKDNLIQLAESWNHDEGKRSISSKVNTIFRNNYNFSCKYAQSVFEDLGIENMCDKCPYKNKNNGIKDAMNIDSRIINQLWTNKASTRHYLLYLDLVDRGLLNRSFIPSAEGINDRTLRELCKLCSLERCKDDKEIIVKYKASNKLYKLPKSFMDQSVEELGDYIKHYLRMLIKGYKATSKYIVLRLSKKTLMDELGYKDVSSLYKMIKKLKDIGLLKDHSKSMYTLYYETYKVINIAPEKDDKDVAENIVDKVVVGQQLKINNNIYSNNKNISYTKQKNKVFVSDPGPPG
ncbi:hypothetical protein [Clostridium hydrogeniformans]|uniref:hypothetical protein n=1 Tax=Clostridium hydrogeniformans TaxID=349933 RepID=UPI0004831323|nr:hypothetical protein [Clostridium hydrogeniformans]